MRLNQMVKRMLPDQMCRVLVAIRQEWQLRQLRILENVNHMDYERYCLLSYITGPFDNITETHQNQWQVTELARLIGEQGYNVDVMDYRSRQKHAPHTYDLLVDIQPLEGSPRLGWMRPDAVKIVYLTGSESRWANDEAQKRRDRVVASRGIVIPPERYALPLDKAVEFFDAAFMLGNEYNWQTFLRAPERMPQVFYIPNGGLVPVRAEGSKRSTHKFLFFASSGQIHKGLDLLLEVFSSRCTDCELFVCSGFLNEQDFCEAYEQELFHTPNIHPVGFVNVQGQEFRKITEKCGYLIVPSCSEARMGAAMYPMAVGCVPILSQACGYDADEAILLPDCNLDTIAATVNKYAAKDKAWLEERSQYYHNVVAEKYSRQAYSHAVQLALSEVLGGRR